MNSIDVKAHFIGRACSFHTYPRETARLLSFRGKKTRYTVLMARCKRTGQGVWKAGLGHPLRRFNLINKRRYFVFKAKKPWVAWGQIKWSYGAIFWTNEIPKSSNTRFASLRCFAMSPTGAYVVIICCKQLLCAHCTRSAKSLGAEQGCVCAPNRPIASLWAPSLTAAALTGVAKARWLLELSLRRQYTQDRNLRRASTVRR